MEIIDFINDLRKKGKEYYNVWLPLILQFHKKGDVFVKIIASDSVSKSKFYKIINYGLSTFPNYIKSYSLKKTYNGIILSELPINKNNFNQDIQDFKKEKEVVYNNSFKIQKKIPDESESVTSVVLVSELKTEKQKTQRKKTAETIYPNEVYEEIIEFLNLATGKKYKKTSATNRKFITQRLNEGYLVDDFKQVITVKTKNWLGGKMEQYLRPETLFSNRFESYLNENVISDTLNSNLKNSYDQIVIATQLINNQG